MSDIKPLTVEKVIELLKTMPPTATIAIARDAHFGLPVMAYYLYLDRKGYVRFF